MKRRSLRLQLEHLEDRTLLSSPGDVEWVREFGSFRTPEHLDPARSVVADGHGNVYVAGSVEGMGALPGQTGSGGLLDAYVRKYDAAGTELWTRQFGTGFDGATGIAVDGSGVYVTGFTLGTLPGQTSAGSDDAFLRKYDLDGNELWTRQFGSSADDSASSIAIDASGVYVTGGTAGTLPGQTSSGSGDVFLRKYDLNGTEVWTRQFGTNKGEAANAVAVDGSGVYLAGTTTGILPGQTSAGDNDAFREDAFVRKYDPSGNELWTRQFGTANFDQANGIAADASGVYVAGVTGGVFPGQTGTGLDAFVRKYDANGIEVWTRQFGSDVSRNALANSITVGASGVYVAGNSGGANHQAFLRKYDVAGTEVWTRQLTSELFGDPQDVGALGVTADASGVYVAGDAGGIFPGQTVYTALQSYVRKYDLDGNEAWTREFTAVVPEHDFARAVDANGNVYVAGYVGGTLDGSPTFGGALLRKYDAAGNEIWTRQFGNATSASSGQNGDSALAVATDGADVYVVGLANTALPGQVSAGGQDAFVRKYDGDGNELWTHQFGSSGFASEATAVAVDGSAVYVAGIALGALPGETSAGDNDAFVRKYDNNGNELWTRQFGTSGSDQVAGLAADPSGVYLSGFTGGTLPGQTSAGGQDAFVRRYDTDGNVLWTSQFGTSVTDSATGISVDPSGVYVSGFTGGTLAGKISARDDDAFVRKYDATGTVQWTRQFGSAGADQATSVAIGATGVYVAGFTSGALPGKTSAGGQDAFVRKYDASGTEVWTGQFGTDGADQALGVAVSASGLFIAGFTTGTFPGQASPGLEDAFVGRIVDNVTVTSLSSSDSAPVFGQSVTLTANVAATSGGLGIPSGTVQFRVDGSDFGGPATLVNGTASISTAGLSAGQHTITAFYGGDDSFAASTADLLNQLVNQATTATAAAVSAPTPLFGVDSLTVSAVVSVVTPGSGNPTGTVTFYDGVSALGTANLVNGAASLMLGNTALAAGSHTIRSVYSGDGNFKSSDSTSAVNVLAPSAIQGLVYVDANNNGQVDFGELGTSGVAVTLTGIDDLGHAVSRTVQTDSNGVYAFINLRPSNATGYTITETQPAGFLDGQDTLGTINGVPVGSNAINDVFSGIVLSKVGLLAENYNFGELPSSSGGVGAGQTAGIGFWQNRNGQNLIRALNGGSSATQLGHWLAMTFPNMYAALDGQTNAQVADFYKMLFARTAQTAPGGPPKVDAQVLATAFAVYVTNQSLAGTTAVAYGFQVDATGVGSRTFNVGAGGAAFGVSNSSNVSVLDLLLAVNARSHNGLLFDLNGDGHIDSSEGGFRTMANSVFTAINEAGGI
jgi:hypothetical protein